MAALALLFVLGLARRVCSHPGQNTYAIDSLDVVPIEKAHALALVAYTIDPADQDIPAFQTTASYLLEKSGGKQASPSTN